MNKPGAATSGAPSHKRRQGTSVRSNLAKSRIAELSPLAAANEFVRSWPI